MLNKLKEKITVYQYSNRWKASRPALCYHSICPEATAQKIHRVTPENFEHHLITLKKRGFVFLTIEEFLKVRLLYPKKKITAVTFDDGYLDVLTYASPILESLEIPFTVFISTCLLEGKMLWRDKIRLIQLERMISSFHQYLEKHDPQLSDRINWSDFYYATKANTIDSSLIDGFLDAFLQEKGIFDIHFNYLSRDVLDNFPMKYASLGNHTHNHYRLSTLDKQKQLEEISRCHELLENLPLRKSNVFAIPFGENGSFNQNTIDIIKDLGYQGFLMTNQDQFGLKTPRINCDPCDLMFSNRILPKNEPFI